MIYRSNLTCPDLTPHFKHIVSRVMGHSFGHDVISDWSDKADDDPAFGTFKQCGFWTHDEAAILYQCASGARGAWVDIGCHTGWTSMHLAAAGCTVRAVDYMLGSPAFYNRFVENVESNRKLRSLIMMSPSFSEAMWRDMPKDVRYRGVVIDGNHDAPGPLQDAIGAEAHLLSDGVILLHDFLGQPVRDAVRWLMAHGFRCRIYWTPHVVACCWRGAFTPPYHVADPFILSQDLPARMPDFDLTRCE